MVPLSGEESGPLANSWRGTGARILKEPYETVHTDWRDGTSPGGYGPIVPQSFRRRLLSNRLLTR